MAFDEELADRVRCAVGESPGAVSKASEKAMFGGLCFLSRGKMFCGIVKDELMVRVGPDAYEDALDEPHVRPMNFTGKPMKGYVFVEPDGCRTEAMVLRWVERAVAFVETLPAATKKPAGKGRRGKGSKA